MARDEDEMDKNNDSSSNTCCFEDESQEEELDLTLSDFFWKHGYEKIKNAKNQKGQSNNVASIIQESCRYQN